MNGHAYFFTHCRESVKELCGVGDEFVEIDQSALVVQSRNLGSVCVCVCVCVCEVRVREREKERERKREREREREKA